MDALYQGRRGGLTLRDSDWSFQSALLEHLETVWQEPDAGIWEMRGPPRQFTFSKVMAWVAFDRGVRTAEQFDLPAPLDRWRRVRAQIHDTVCRQGFDAELGSFTQAFESGELDASLLLLPTVGFLPASDARVRGTITAIERALLIDGVVLRYRTDSGADGLPPGEGAFLACTLWLADAFVLIGRLEDARRLFDHVRSLANDVGLLAEEYDPRARRLVGNFPQAFSHVAIINTAHNLARSTKPAEQRAS
jgi:GH15 family glucan-1,4-alpha-glucosidase